MSAKTVFVGICGGSWGRPVGKTLAANILSEAEGFKVASFSAPISKFAKDVLHWDGVMDDNGRKVVDRVCRVGRGINEDYWLGMAMRLVDPSWERVVFDDLFFENEQILVKSLGGKIIRVSMPGVPDDAVWMKPDFSIVNEGKSVDDLKDRILAIIPLILT